MKLKKLTITQLYGKDFEVSFNENLTILYGLNGSGKTTILNIIYNILRGEIKKLLEYKFDTLELEFEFRDKNKKFMIENTDVGSSISFDGSLIELHDTDREIYSVYEKKNIHEDFEELADYYYEDKKDLRILSGSTNDRGVEKLIASKIKSLSNMVYIPLNRKVKGVDEAELTVNHRYRISSNKKNIEDSLQRAKRYFESYKKKIVFRENRIHIKMRSQMILNFSNPINSNYLLLKESHDFSNLVADLEEFIGKNSSENIRGLIENYVSTKDSYSLENTEPNIKDNERFIKHIFALAQLSKLSEVFNTAKTEKQRIDEYKKHLERVLDSINLLFSETKKKVGYSDTENKLYFVNLDDSNKKIDIVFLSSGEKQIVVFFIFALINYNERKNKILLVDEPELSLHIEWQSKILPLLIDNESNSQLIIATHSPDIIGAFEDKMVEVRGI